ncbi:hypothetical protein, partial [uncultured Microscilla sp.]|uniref:hypothetical protein n=1 Tax=uncultured Microscilla sp. TaxID=432653 RepID=UPI002621A203
KITETIPYYSGFENATGGWLTHGTIGGSNAHEGSSWQLKNGMWQMPGGYAANEQSYVASPAFDIDQLT